MTNDQFPHGDGKANCAHCKGRGVVPLPQDKRKSWMVGEITTPCRCTINRDRRDNVKRAWGSALAAEPLAAPTPLLNHREGNLWLRADNALLRAHVRSLGMNSAPRWPYKVISDVDLMTTWLYSANEVIDGDVGLSRMRGENTSTRISDLVEPWDLVILRLGVKAARNNATPEVLLEAILHREQMGKPTWIVDSPLKPFSGEGHRAWSLETSRYIAEWPFLDLTRTSNTRISAPPKETIARQTPMAVKEAPKEEDDFFSTLVNTNPTFKKRPFRK